MSSCVKHAASATVEIVAYLCPAATGKLESLLPHLERHPESVHYDYAANVTHLLPVSPCID